MLDLNVCQLLNLEMKVSMKQQSDIQSQQGYTNT